VCENEHLLETILRLDWRFVGYVLSDYGAAHPDGTAASLNDGLDFEPWPGWCYSIRSCSAAPRATSWRPLRSRSAAEAARDGCCLARRSDIAAGSGL